MIEAVPMKRSLFNSFMFEAPGDEEDGNVSVTVAPRANRGNDYGDDTVKATVRPTAARGATDYGADDDTEDTPDDTADAQDAGDDTTTDDTGDTDEGDDTDADTATDYGADDDDGTGDTGDESGDSASEGDGGDDADAPTDYGADDGGDDGSTDDGEADSGDSGDGNSNGNNKGEALRKFHMYSRFQHLYNVIETFVEKLRDVVKDDPTQNAVIKRVTTNFANLYDNLYDFMMVKFSRASYVELLVYMEQAVAICKLNFELLKNNRIELKQYPNDWK